MKALVVDDSNSTRLVIKAMLSEINCSIVEARDGLDALEKIANESKLFDVLLVDWNMPVMDGLEFIKKLRENEMYSLVPVLMVTTENELKSVVTALEAGADEYIMKPFSKEAIFEKFKILELL